VYKSPILKNKVSILLHTICVRICYYGFKTWTINFSRDGNFPKKYAQVIGQKKNTIAQPKGEEKISPLENCPTHPNPSPSNFKKQKTMVLP